MGEPTKRVARVRRGVTDPAIEQAGPGDRIELSMTAEVKNSKGRSFWVKAGLASDVREDETGAEAKERVAGFVATYVEEQISEYLG